MHEADKQTSGITAAGQHAELITPIHASLQMDDTLVIDIEDAIEDLSALVIKFKR